ncbi:General substrate transporter [Pleurostoma richardsiae]|uniref:General substrate transporter n=1 Tax=Pleurostoma richardsiae TaxID=41990 RepID=A0AA38VLT2_9PEZI|nr:General substrate transporter [Pleurostoma richardsiae]
MDLKAWRHVTPYLVFNCLVFLQGAILFGIDTGSFGSLQALPSFLTRFGIKNDAGKFNLPATRKSLLNSLPWIGKIAGCMWSEPFIDRAGYKKAMYAVVIIQIVGLIVEMTAHHWAQFSAGRIITYSAVGMVENAVPAYNAESCPAGVRGLLSGGIMTVTALGNLWGAGMSRAYSTEQGDKGWMIPVAMQFIPAVGLLLLVPFTPESPRWLILKGRKAQAKAVLDKIRPKRDVDSGATAAEADALEQLVEESLANEKGSWLDIFRGNYLRRTWISMTLFVLEQTNGNQFVLSYGATFYVQQGLGAMSFTYNIIGQVIGTIGCAAGVLLTDTTGRRPLFIFGSALTTFFLYLASGLGTISNPNQSETNMILACFMLLPAFCRISATNNAFLTGAEIGGVRMRKKIMAFGTVIDVIAAFLVTFVTPYLLPSMGVKIGWIFGSVAAFSLIWGIFFFPELKGRSLEEVDELFAANLQAWQFKRYETHGTGRLLAALENEGMGSGKLQTEEVEAANAARSSGEQGKDIGRHDEVTRLD